MNNISEDFIALLQMTNQTNQEKIALYYHPILYGVGIYALLLVIIGTIGKTIDTKKTLTVFLCVGNGLTIIILLRPNLHRYTTMRYLIAVAIADLCSLYSWNLNLFYKHLINRYQNDLEDSSIILCRLISFIAFVSLQLSSWYLALVSIDRCLNIHLLFWHKGLGRASRSSWIILLVTILIGVINSHLLFFNGYRESNCQPFEKRTCFICYARLNDPYYIFPKWEQVHVIIYNLIPFSLMSISNCFIIRRTISTSIRHLSADRVKKDQPSRKYRLRKQKQLTYILLFVTFLFVTLTTPVMIYNVFLRNYMRQKRPLKYILQGLLLCMQYTSHAVGGECF